MLKQKGNTLIVVLIVLLLIMIIGAIAVRSSILGLSIATSNQISNLLLQNNDAVMFELKDPKKIKANMISNQIYGYFTSVANTNDELTFCYRADQSNFFNIQDASVIGSNKIGSRGYCKRTWFASGRSAVLSQVYIKRSPPALLQNLGESDANQVGARISILAAVISVAPTFASATDREIEACFRKPADKRDPETGLFTDRETVDECFQKLNIPYNLQSAAFIVASEPK